jgi:hypothetical protein
MGRRVHDVRPIEHRGDAGIERSERAEQVADVDVLRSIMEAEGAEHQLDVDREIALRDQRSGQRLPGVAVGIDQAWHRELVSGIDYVGVCHSKVAADGGDRAVVDQDVGGIELSDRSVEHCDVAALDQDPICRPRLCRDRPHHKRHAGGASSGCQQSASCDRHRPLRACAAPRCWTRLRRNRCGDTAAVRLRKTRPPRFYHDATGGA